MEDSAENLNFFSQIKDLLRTAADNPDHPFALPALTSTGADGVSRPRKVVLRGAARELSELRCYTDRRSVKAGHLAADSEFSYLFWDPGSSLQLMCGGPSRWAGEEEARSVFSGLPKHGRKAYATEDPPGTALPMGASGLPANWERLSLEETDYAGEHFGILLTTPRWADILHLDRSGNRRLSGTRASGQWNWGWIVP